jgi:hypothetical protein
MGTVSEGQFGKGIREENEQLRRKIREQELQIAELVEGIEEIHGNGGHNFEELKQRIVQSSQFQVLGVMAMLAAEVLCCSRLRGVEEHRPQFLFLMVCPAICVCLFAAKWTKIEFARAGLLEIVVKWGILVVGIEIIRICNFGPWVDRTGFDGFDVRGAIIGLLTLGVALVSRLSEWLINRPGNEIWESGLVRKIRRCF